MAQWYPDVTHYVIVARLQLQDGVQPYRYTDDTIVRSLNSALAELGRIRPDMLLDLKYVSPLRRGDIGDGVPGPYTTTDIGFDGSGNYVEGKGTLVPVPVKYMTPLEWFVTGWCQFLDVTDTQDQRAQAFLTKFQAQLMTVNAA